MKSKWIKLILLLAVAATAGGASVYLQPFGSHGADEAVADDALAHARSHRVIITTGRVETIDGEVDLAAEIGGRLSEVRVREGDAVTKGQVLAVLQGERQIVDVTVAEENVALAKSRLARLIAGNGAEEIARALSSAKAIEAELIYEQRSLDRWRTLGAKAVVSQEDLDQKRQRVASLQHQLESGRKNYEALRRGPLAEEIATARAALAVAESQLSKAKVEHELRFIRAPIDATVLKVYRHAGDAVMIDQVTPILRLANTDRLRIRLEIDEADVPLVQPGISGQFKIRGISTTAGRLKVKTIVPSFGPKRLFNPDASARHDARTLEVLCEIQDSVPLYPGQRMTAEFEIMPAKPNTR
jgi:multidrug resistance efflux pump